MALPATDNFNRASLGSNWTVIYGSTWTIASSIYVANDTVAECAIFWNADSFPDDQYSQVKTVGPSGGYIGPCVRASGSGYIGLYVSQSYGGYMFYSNGDGSDYNSIASGPACTLGSVIYLSAEGTPGETTTLKSKDDGVQYIADQTTSVDYTGKAGITSWKSSTQVTGDDWEGGSLASGVSGSLSVTLGALTAAATGTVEISGSTTATLAALTLSGTGAVDIVGVLGETLAALTLSATGQHQTDGALSVTLEALAVTGSAEVDVSGTLAATLGAMTVAGTAVIPVEGQVSQTLEALAVSAQGVVGGGTPVSGSLDVTLGALAVSGIGAVAIEGLTAATLASLTAAGTATVLVQGSLAATLDALTLESIVRPGSPLYQFTTPAWARTFRSDSWERSFVTPAWVRTFTSEG